MAALEFVRLDERATIPSRAHEGDAGLDLSAIEGDSVAPGERVLVRTGLAVAIPAGCAGLVLPRSGLASRHGVTVANAPGRFEAGDRIAQLVVVSFPGVEPTEVRELGSTSRGDGGFGSSGRS